MSNEDQLNEIEALESIFGEQFSFCAPHHKYAIKVHLQPHQIEDPDAGLINHVQCDVSIIFGSEYPQQPLFRIDVDAKGMDEYKLDTFQIAVNDAMSALIGPDHQTITNFLSQSRKTSQDAQIRADFDEITATLDSTVKIITNPSGITTRPGEIYLFELLESIREWLTNNNTREIKSLRDAVQNIDEIDDKQRRKERGEGSDCEEDEDDEGNMLFDDPYDEQDNIFTQEYESEIIFPDGTMCTQEAFDVWSPLFLQEQAAWRAKCLAEAGKLQNDHLPTGKQLFLSNMVGELLDDDVGGNAFTFVRPTQPQNAAPQKLQQEDNEETIDLDAIDISLFDDSDDDEEVAAAVVSSPPAPEPEKPKEEVKINPEPQQAVKSPESTTKSKKDKDSNNSSSKDKKDDKKKEDKKDDKKKDAKKDDKKKDDKKKGAKKDTFDLGGGFADFLGDF